MQLKFKVILFIVTCVLIDAFAIYYSQGVDASIKTDLAMAAVNGGHAENAALRQYQVTSNQLYLSLLASNLVIGLLLFWSNIKSTTKQLKENL